MRALMRSWIMLIKFQATCTKLHFSLQWQNLHIHSNKNKRYKEAAEYDFCPSTFVLPEDYAMFVEVQKQCLQTHLATEQVMTTDQSPITGIQAPIRIGLDHETGCLVCYITLYLYIRSSCSLPYGHRFSKTRPPDEQSGGPRAR